ncbi:MAG: phosphoribosylamine--glycine ligase [Spirochaetota bacterium]|nr:phosphoribosylamine--glycine ligase [Spirochaetota bacterium]
MKYLIIGSGGREHALYWRLLSDGSAKDVYVAPGNGGISDEYRIDIKIDDFSSICAFCIEKSIDAVIVGPEAPLCSGIVDYLDEKKIPVFGPSRSAARLEGSKLFAKYIMDKYNISTAKHKNFSGKKELLEYIENINSYPVVIKVDGLAAGKGVGIPENKNEAVEFINMNVQSDTSVLIEDYIEGEEASVLGISDGENIIPFVAAQDHKRIYDGDKGPNTGGMGAYAPAPVVDKEKFSRVYSEILKPTVDGMKSESSPFKGILYAGLIINGNDIDVLEFNVRFGDPEVQVILPLLNGKLGDIIENAIVGNLKFTDISFLDKYAISVVISSGGYPGSYEKGKQINGLDTLSDDIIVFHAGTRFEDGNYYTNGGRVLNITAIGDDISSARNKVYSQIEKISFEGAFYRKDIAMKAMKYIS